LNLSGDVTGIDFATTPTYDLSGTITLNGMGLGGVSVSDGQGHVVTTGSDGTFILSGLPPGEYTLTPTRSGHKFNPLSRKWQVGSPTTGLDFTATTPIIYLPSVINGYVTPFAGP
jgi:hypothetical protein